MNDRCRNISLWLVIILNVFLLSYKGNAQPNELYPFKWNPIFSIQSADSVLVHELLDKGNKAVIMDTAIGYFKQALQISQKSGYVRGEAIAYHNIAVVYQVLENELLFEENVYHSMRAFRQLNNDSMVIAQYIALSYFKLKKGKYKDVINLYHQALPLFKTASPATFLKLYNTSANAYFQLSLLDSAIIQYRKIIAISSVTSSSVSEFLVFDTYIGLGSIFSTLKLDEQSKYYFFTAQKLGQSLNDKGLMAKAMSHLGASFRNEQNFAASKKWCKDGLELLSTVTDYTDTISMMENISHCASCVALALIDEDSMSAALPYSKLADDNAVFFSSKLQTAYALGFNYAMVGEYAKAIHHTENALSVAQKNNMEYNINNAYQVLAVSYEGLKQYKQAHHYQKKLAETIDKYLGKENAEKVAKVEEQYKTAEKDKQLAQHQLELAQQENKLKQKNWLIVLVVIVGGAIVVLLSIRYRIKQKTVFQEQEITYLQERMKGEELERGRIAQELHDGVSVLLSAAKMNHATLAKKNKSVLGNEEYAEVEQLLDNTIQELRNVSTNLIPEQLIRQTLPAAIESFCSLIEKGHGIEFEVQYFGSWSSFDAEFSYGVYRIVQELVHNIIKHAKASKAIIQLLIYEDIVSLTVDDDGVGYEDNRKSHHGMGLKNIQNRVKDMQGTFYIKRKTRESGTLVEIEFPYKY